MTSRIFIALPSGRGAPDIDCVASLNGTLQDLREHGVEYQFNSIHGNCYIALVRSLLTHQFMQSQCTHLFFWDDDVAAPPGALRRLLGYDRDIIVAAYPKKVPAGSPPEKAWPISLTDGIPDEAGLLESDMVATGFLLIKRDVIEALYEKYGTPDLGADGSFEAWLTEFDRVRAENPQGLAEWMIGAGRPPIRPACDFHHKDGAGYDVIDLFPTGIIESFPKNAIGKNMWWGEDYSLSVLAKRLGFRIWMDPKIQLLHAGRNVWHGNFVQQAAD